MTGNSDKIQRILVPRREPAERRRDKIQRILVPRREPAERRRGKILQRAVFQSRASGTRGRSGFTLIELTVAFGIFGLVTLGVTGVFITALRIHRQSAASQALIDTVRFSLEFMEREMRTGRRFALAGNELVFCNDRGAIVRYRLDGERIVRSGSGENCSEGTVAFEALTAPEILIEDFIFRLAGESDADTLQPRITLTFKAQSRADPALRLRLETTVSQRDVDIRK